jgi:hypothetical protein
MVPHMGELMAKNAITNEEREQLALRKARYSALLDLCLNGKTGPDDAKLAECSSDVAFCVCAAMNSSFIDFYTKLFSIQDAAEQALKLIPTPMNEAQACEKYMADARATVLQLAQDLSDEEIKRIGHDAMQYAGAHFTGKLVHSAAEGWAFVRDSRPTCNPHLSSRTIAKFGGKLPLDQRVLDNKGTYQRVVSVLEGNADLAEFGVPDRLRSLILAGATEAAEKIDTRQSITAVDHRLRRLALPREGGYVCVTPLGAGGYSKLINDQIKEGLGLPEADNRSAMVRRIVSIVSMPIGGANPRNASLHTRLVQNALYYEAPTKNYSLNQGIRFLKVGYRAYLDKEFKSAYEKWLAKTSDYLQGSSTLEAIRMESKSPLFGLVLRLHQKNLVIAGLLASEEFQEPLKASTRTYSKLEACIIRGAFGTEYATELAGSLASKIEGAFPQIGKADRVRVEQAVVNIICRITGARS